jgi:hypothetical protein
MAPPEEQAPKKRTTQVIIDQPIAAKIRVIVAAQETTIQNWVNSRLAEIIDREFEAVLHEMGLDVKPRQKPKP